MAARLGTRVLRLERASGVGVGGDDEQFISLRLFEARTTRADALGELWAGEVEAARKAGVPADPARVLRTLHLFDTETHPHLLIVGNRDHRQPTNFAYDFREWSREEVELFAKLKLGVADDAFSAAEFQLCEQMKPRFDKLMAKAERTWAQDERELRQLTNAGPNIRAME